MIDEYLTVAKAVETESSVKKSKFICNVCPVDRIDEAQAFLEAVRKKYRDANHNVWAWRVGQELPQERFSDDGEPAGIAGMPVLEVFRKKSLINCMVIVTRYFGGTLLGAGGLVRAYTDSAVQGVTEAGIARFCRYQGFTTKIPYSLLGSVLKMLEDAGARLEEPLFDAEVLVRGWAKPSHRPSVEKSISELGSGLLDIRWDGDRFLCDG